MTSIGYEAFYHCTSLTGVYITDIAAWCNIEFGGFYANPLYYAKNLYLNDTLVTDLVIPSTVTSIGESAFYYCTSLTSVTFAEGSQLISIGFSAFACSCLTSITIPSSVTIINEDAFYGCTSLANVTFLENSQLRLIRRNAFFKCTNLTKFTIPANVWIIEVGAFCACYKLIEVYNFSSLNITTDLLFDSKDDEYYFTNIYTNETIQSKLFAENDYIFYDDGTNRYLMSYTGTATELTLPANCNGNQYELYPYAFYNRKDITSVTFGDNNRCAKIGISAFEYCSSLTSVTFAKGSQLTSIGYSAFQYCTSLTSIEIPASITSIGGDAFFECKKLKNVIFDDNSQLESIGGRAFYNCDNLQSITIPEGVTNIGGSAFHSCERLKSIEIPASVTSIGSYAFASNYFSNVTFADNSQLKSIGLGAFRNCVNLKSITIPEGVTNIDADAFSLCKRLTSITIPASVTSIGYEAFSGCISLTSVTFAETSGWTAGGSTISATDLADPATAARYLRLTYDNYYWNRTEE